LITVETYGRIGVRKPRVIIFNYSGRVQHELSTFLSHNGYEACVVTVSETCPIYDERENTTCPGPVLCCDVMVAVQERAPEKSVDLFDRQLSIGCKLTSRNKTIITHSLSREGFDHFTARGITLFGNPLDFGVFEAWIKDCESRMDMMQRLAVKRRTSRHPSGKHVQLRVPGEDIDINAQAVNVSGCGICLEIPHRLKVGEVLLFKRASAEEGIVRWTKKLEKGRYLAGVTFCV
jgi:hypothetical protein